MTASIQRAAVTQGKLTGWHVLAMLIAFFGVTFIANGFLVYYALETFSGTVTDSSYQASQHYNLDLAAARDQEKRHWRVAADAQRDPAGAVAIRIEARDASNQPVANVDFHATLQRPTSRSEDRPVLLMAQPGAAGVYVGSASDVALGQWNLVIEADPVSTKAVKTAVSRPETAVPVFQSEHRLVFR